MKTISHTTRRPGRRARASAPRFPRAPLFLLPALRGLLLLLFVFATLGIAPSGVITLDAAKIPAAHDARDTAVTGPDLSGITGADNLKTHASTDSAATTAGAGNTTALTGPAGDHDTTVGDIETGGGHTADIAGIEGPAPRPPVTPPAGSGSGGVIPGGKTLPGFTITAPGEVIFTAPQNPLYTITTAPDSPYLVVTDPRFTDWNNFISSDYFFQKLQSDPQAMHKRLGDGFYENRLILDQITALTGRRFLGDYRAEDEQFMALMDNALAIAESFHLRPGLALTPAQIDALETDIVWLVETLVNGQTVLAPVVYLSRATLAQIEDGAVIAARDIDLEITGDAINNGVIRADRDMRLAAATLLNDGGALKTGGDMVLVAKTDITSRAGRITAGGDATLSAGRDILLASVADVTDYAAPSRVVETKGFAASALEKLGLAATHEIPGATAVHTTVREQTLSAGGNLVLNAGRDLTLTGVGVTAGGAAALIAARDLTLDTVRAVNSFDSGGGAGAKNYLRTGQVTHTLTTLDIAGSLALRAGAWNAGAWNAGGPPADDSGSAPDPGAGAPVPPAPLGAIAITSAQLRAGGDLTLAATGNIDLTAVKDRDFSDTRAEGKKRMDRALRDDETVLGATLQTAGNLALTAGGAGLEGGTGVPPVDGAAALLTPDSSNPDSSATGGIRLQSAYLNAAGSLTLAATGDITLSTLDEHHEEITESMRKKSGALSSKTTTTYDRADYTDAVGSTLSADRVTAQAGRDLSVIGSTVAAGHDIALSAGRDLAVAAAQETYSEEHYKEVKKSGVFSSGAIGFTVGKQQQSTAVTAGGAAASASVIGSTAGRVDLLAGGRASITGSELLAGAGLSIDAAGIAISAAEQTTTLTRVDKSSQSGVSVALRGGWADMLYAEQGKQMRGASVVEDERVEGLNKIRNASGAINSDGVEAGGASFAVMTVAIGYGSKSSERVSSETATSHLGSTLQSGGDLTLVARGGESGSGVPPLGSAQGGGGVPPLGSAQGGGGVPPLDGASARSGGAGVPPVGSENTGDITIAGSYLTAAGAVGMAAARDIDIRETLDRLDTQADGRRKQGDALGHQATTDASASAQTLAAGSVVTGDTVTLLAGRDLGVRGSTLAADHDIHLEAGRDVAITAATETQAGSASHQVSKSGMFDSGQVSITFGSQKQSFAQEETGAYAAGSLIGSTAGRVDIVAGGAATVAGSELFSETGLSISADRIAILAAEQTGAGSFTQDFSQGGLTVRLQGGILDAGLALINTIERAEQADDDRLKGLYAARAARQGYELYQNAQGVAKAAEGGGAGAAGSALGIELAIAAGAKSSHAENVWASTQFAGSRLDTAGELTLTARGDQSGSGVPPLGSGGIHIAGSDLSGQDITLSAKNNLLIESALDAYKQDGSNKNSGWEGGVALSLGQGGVGVKIFADAEAGKGFEKGNGVTNLNSHLDAAGTLTLVSGNDTTLSGAVAKGDAILADIGGNLTLESRQDSDYYKAKQEQISGGASFTIGSMSGEAHASYNLGKTDSDYASVAGQTGLFAGEGGFDIQVGGHTQLTGAVIASEADAAKNKLSTQTLGFADIANHAGYEAQSIGVSAGSKGAPSGGMSRQADDESGVTRSAIAEGGITVRADHDVSGNRIQDSLAGLSRDTATANDGAVENKFDPQKLAEKQELAQLAGEVGFQAVGDISKLAYEKQVRELKEKYRVDDQTGAPQGMTQDEVNAYYAELARINNTWDDGGVAKIILHTAVGAAQASLGGGDVLSGALGAGVAEAARKVDVSKAILGEGKWIRDANGKIVTATGEAKAIDQLLSTAIGLGAGAVAGDAMTGAGAAWSAEQHNRQLHDGKNGTKDELGKLKDEAARLAADPALQAEYGIYGTEDEILNKLRLAAFEMVKYGDEIKADKLYHYTTKEMQAIGGAVAKGEIAYLEQFQKDGFFTYDEKNAEVDKYAATGRFSEKYYRTVAYDDYGRAIKVLNSEGRALKEAYDKEKSGGYLDLVKGFNTAAPVISAIAQTAKNKLPWENEAQTLLPERKYDSGWRETAFGNKPGEVSKADYDHYIRWQVYDRFLPEESPKTLWGLITLTDYSAKGAYLDTSVSNYGLLEARALDANGQFMMAFGARMKAMPQAGLEFAAQNIEWITAIDGGIALGQLGKAGIKAGAGKISQAFGKNAVETSGGGATVNNGLNITTQIDASGINVGAKAAESEMAVIGRVKDLQKLGPGEKSLLDRLPDLGNPKANWQQNSGVLRQEMNRGLPIRDASPGNTGGQFLNAERNLLQDRGWTFDAKTNLWMPPKG